MAIKTNAAGMEDVFALYLDGEQVKQVWKEDAEGNISPVNEDAIVLIKGEEVAVKSDIPDAYVDPNWTTTGTARKNLTMGIYKLQQSSNPTANADVVNKQTMDAQLATKQPTGDYATNTALNLKADKTELLWELKTPSNVIEPKSSSGWIGVGEGGQIQILSEPETDLNVGNMSYLKATFYTKEQINDMLKVIGGEVVVNNETGVLSGDELIFSGTPIEPNYYKEIFIKQDGTRTMIYFPFIQDSTPQNFVFKPDSLTDGRLRFTKTWVLSPYSQETALFLQEIDPATLVSSTIAFPFSDPTRYKLYVVRYPESAKWEQYLNYLNLSKELLPTGEPKQWISFADWTKLPASQGGGLDEETIPA